MVYCVDMLVFEQPLPDEEPADWVLSTRVPIDVRDALRALAAAEHRTVSQELRRMIERYLQHEAH